MSRSAMEIMTAADIHVRPARPSRGASTRGRRVSPLARLLLRSARELCLLVLLPMSACIIPVGPDFRDPDGVPNSPPFIISATPTQGSNVPEGTLFTVTASDNDVGDHLYFRWVMDFPPLVPSTRFQADEIQPAADGTRAIQPKSFTFECFNMTSPSPHRVMVIVSDRPFLSNSANPGAVPANVHPAIVSWVWEADCPRLP
jgi:hypothetical protein